MIRRAASYVVIALWLASGVLLGHALGYVLLDLEDTTIVFCDVTGTDVTCSDAQVIP